METVISTLKTDQQKLVEIQENSDPKYASADTVKPGDASYDLLSPFKVGYSQTREQEFLFYNGLYDFNPFKHSIIDIGCGRADLYGYLTELYPTDVIKYTGIDNNPEMFKLAKEKYNFEIIQSDFNDVENVNADYVFASGIFTTTTATTESQSITNILKSVDKLYNMANFAVSFNLLTSKNNHIHEGYLFISPGKIIDKLINKYAFVNVYHNYSDSIYTVTIFK